jgi:hypothetical protein
MSPFCVLLSAVALLLSGPANAGDPPPRVALPEAAGRTYAQNYADIALALCIAEAYSADPHAKADAISSAGGIDEWSNFDLQAGHEAMSALITSYLARDYPSIHGPQVRLDLMKCLDLFHSKELAGQVRRFVPAPGHTYQGDNPPAKR